MPKQKDYLPDIVINSEDFEMTGAEAISFYKMDSQELAKKIIRNVKNNFQTSYQQEDYIFCTSSFCSRYDLKSYHRSELKITIIEAYFNQENNSITLTTVGDYESHWLLLVQVFLKFYESARKNGYNIYYANHLVRFQLPFLKSSSALLITEEMEKIGNINKKFVLFDLEQLDYYSQPPAVINLVNTQNVKGINYLIQNKIDLNRFSANCGNNLLHEAVYTKNKAMIELLFQAGVDVTHRNKNGQTPLELANDMGYLETEDWLAQCGISFVNGF